MIAPFLAYITYDFLDIDFKRIMQLLSYVGVFLILIFKTKNKPVIFPRYLLFYLLFILYIFFSTFLLLDREFDIKYLFSFRLIGAFNLLFIVENLSIPEKYYTKIFRISKAILVVAFIVIIIQQTISVNFFLRTEFVDDANGESGTKDRLYSIYSWFGGYLAIGFSFIPIFIVVVEVLLKKHKKVLGWILLGVLFAVLSKARWIMLNTLLVFFLLIIHNKNKTKAIIKYSILIPSFAVMSFFVLSASGIDAEGILNDRILEKDKGSGFDKKSAGTRILAFKAFDKFYWKQPVFGKGSIKYGMGGTGKQDYELQQFLGRRSTQIHVGYLSLFYMYGLIGGALFISFLYLLLKKLYRDAKKTKLWSPFLGILGFALANWTLVSFNLFEIGFIFAFIVNKFYLQQINIPNNSKQVIV